MAYSKITDDDKKPSSAQSAAEKSVPAIDIKAAEKAIEKISKKAETEALKVSDKFGKRVKGYVREIKDDMKEAFSSPEEWTKSLAQTLSQNVKNLASGYFSGVDSFLNNYQQYYSNIQTRMLGTNKTYEDMLMTIQRAVGGSRSTSVVSVLNKLNDLVSKGIAYNVEQRAFLSTLSDKIATTFDATNGTLVQLVRINRNDSTAAYLGMEAALTEYLNGQFKDTSYLTSNINESVSAALYEATSQMGAQEGAAFEYAVQKWLGSFYSSGMNSDTISKLATGIGYLGSGNVSALNSNSELNSLMAMASNYAGLDYSQLLTQGLTSTTVNKLLQGVYKQAYTMATSGDQVAKSQYAQLFGMTLSDLTAMLRLSTSDLISISDNMLTYSGMIAKTEYELSQVNVRTSIVEKVQNALQNAYAAAGEQLASNPGAYATYEISKAVGSLPVYLPYIGEIDIAKVTRASILGFSMLERVGDVLGSLFSNKTLSLSSFAGASAETFGQGMVTGTGGSVAKSTGGLSYIGSGRSSELIGSALTGNEEQTETVKSSVDTPTTYDLLTDEQSTVMKVLLAIRDSAAVTADSSLRIDSALGLRVSQPDM